ncbi:MAG: hypothetical protein LBR69_05530 [Endomicrobium sp.]|nr:hypothetical protein [Endomicrobium sp.]
MKKRIWSYVLAAVLAISLAGATFAAPVQTENEAGGPAAVSKAGTITNSMEVGSSIGSEDINKAMGRISQVFNYIAGILVNVIDGDRNVTIFDAGEVRATMGYNSNGTFTLTSLNFFGRDQHAIDKAGGFEKFLSAFGVPAQQLQAVLGNFNEQGQMVTKPTEETDAPKYGVVGWMNKAAETLKKGVNHSISIDLTAAGGASLTVKENGNALFSYSGTPNIPGNVATPGHDGLFVTAEYKYDNHGFLKEVVQTVFEVDVLQSLTEDQKKTMTELGISENEYEKMVKAKENWLAANPSKKAEDYDKTAAGQELQKITSLSQGKGDTVYKQGTRTTYYKEGKARYVTDGNGTKLSETTYSKLGNINSSKDLETNNVTYFVGGQAAYVVNHTGSRIQEYVRHSNGTMDGVKTYSDSGVAQITAYSYGKALATADVTSDGKPNSTFDSLRTAWKDIVTNNSVSSIEGLIEANSITNIQYYAEHMSNTAFMTVMGMNADDVVAQEKTKIRLENELNAIIGGEQKSLSAEEESLLRKQTAMAWTAMLNNNGFSAVGSARFTLNESTHEVGGEGGDVWSWSHSQSSGSGTEQEFRDSYTNSRRISVATDEDFNSSGVRRTATVTSAASARVYSKTLGVNTTVMSMGQSLFTLNCVRDLGSTVTDTTPPAREVDYTYDPVIEGELKGFVGENGEPLLNEQGEPMTEAEIADYIENGGIVYASVNAEWANVMDGGAGEVMGEEMLVQITDVAAYKQLAGSVNKTVMLMGDVTTDVDGKKTMVMNTTYGGGVLTDTGAISEMKDLIIRIGKGEATEEEISNPNNKWIKDNIDSNVEFFKEQGIENASLAEKWNKLVEAGKKDGVDYSNDTEVAIRAVFDEIYNKIIESVPLREMNNIEENKQSPLNRTLFMLGVAIEGAVQAIF